MTNGLTRPYSAPAEPTEAARASDFAGSSGRRITRRRSSAGPVAPNRPVRPAQPLNQRSGPKPTYLTLRDHGKVYVADLPRLSDGQLAQVAKEAQEVLSSLQRRLETLAAPLGSSDDTLIRATTKREVSERFLKAVQDELELRRSNPALRAAAGESLAKAFLELARHRLPGSTFDSLLEEALDACGPEAAQQAETASRRVVPIVRHKDSETDKRPLPVVLTPEAS